jgi:hypothetical protein
MKLMILVGPWWLVRKGRNEDAKRSIARCATAGYYSDEELNARVALIEHTHALEHAETKEQSILNCFKGSNLRRTEIVRCFVTYRRPRADKAHRRFALFGPFSTGAGSR